MSVNYFGLLDSVSDFIAYTFYMYTKCFVLVYRFPDINTWDLYLSNEVYGLIWFYWNLALTDTIKAVN